MATWTGLAQLNAKIKRIGPEAKSRIRQALAEVADGIVENQRRLAPVSKHGKGGRKPGALRDSIVATMGDGTTPKYSTFNSKNGTRRVLDRNDELSVRITAGNSEVRYAHLVEFGTKPHQLREGVEHPGSAAHPYFYPGYKQRKNAAKRRIRKVTKEVGKALAKGKK